mgnify:CR=1 FL=1
MDNENISLFFRTWRLADTGEILTDSQVLARLATFGSLREALSHGDISLASESTAFKSALGKCGSTPPADMGAEIDSILSELKGTFLFER